MDFSDYPVEHPCHDKTNKKKLGYFKDECSSKIITKFIALKPKSYAFAIHGEDDEHKKSKGVVKHKVKKELTYQSYEQALYENKKHQITYNFIRSRNHQLFSMSQVKQSLSNFENKRWYKDAFYSLLQLGDVRQHGRQRLRGRHRHLPRHGLAGRLEHGAPGLLGAAGRNREAALRSLRRVYPRAGAAVGGHAGPVQHADQGLGLRGRVGLSNGPAGGLAGPHGLGHAGRAHRAGQRGLRPAAVQRRELHRRVHHGRGRLGRSLLCSAHSHRRRRRDVHRGRVRQLAEHQRRGQRGPQESRAAHSPSTTRPTLETSPRWATCPRGH